MIPMHWIQGGMSFHMLSKSSVKKFNVNAALSDKSITATTMKSDQYQNYGVCDIL